MMLRDVRLGKDGSREKLAEVMYSELRALAGALMADERIAHTLQPTALVHEAYAKLMRGAAIDAKDRGHFMAIAAKAMRQVLIDHARSKRADKRGGGRVFTIGDSAESGLLHDQQATESGAAEKFETKLDVLDLDHAMQELSRVYPRAARVVEMRFFGGLNVQDAALVLGTGEATVERDWALARGWLRRKLSGLGANEEFSD